MTTTAEQGQTRDYTLPEGCLACEADLDVRVSSHGPYGVCRQCGWMGRPIITMTHKGMQVSYAAAVA